MIPISEALRSRLRVIKADITTLNVDAIVNSADADLTGGGEVDKAIHKAAGPELRKACRTYVLEQGRCFAGGASLTESFNLPCRFEVNGDTKHRRTDIRPVVVDICEFPVLQ